MAYLVYSSIKLIFCLVQRFTFNNTLKKGLFNVWIRLFYNISLGVMLHLGARKMIKREQATVLNALSKANLNYLKEYRSERHW